MSEQHRKRSAYAEAIYISGGCNRCPKALDWGGSQSQILYALNNSIALVSDEEPREIKCTFNKHTDRVNSVRWISSHGFFDQSLLFNSSGVGEFVSASKDKSLIVWKGRDQLVSVYYTFSRLSCLSPCSPSRM